MKNSTREFPPQEITELTMPAERGFFSWMQMITSVQMLLGKSLLKKEEIDLAVMDYSMIQGEECSRHYYKKEMEAMNPVCFQKDILKPQSGAGFVWAKLYRREWLQETGVRFDTELSAAEDAEFMLRVALKNPRIWNVP